MSACGKLRSLICVVGRWVGCAVRLFAMATLAPAMCLLLAVAFGGWWPWISVGYLTGLVLVLDRLMATEINNADPGAEFPAADTLLVALGVLHLVILALCLWVVAGATHMSGGAKVAIAIAAGLFFGQISHPTAHELIHRPNRGLHHLGRTIYTSLLVGHHASAHLRVHHVHVGRDADPNSPRPGEGFYRYMLRASRQSFVAGLKAETKLRANRPRPIWTHPYVAYLGGGLGLIALVWLTSGVPALGMLVFLAGYAQIQILMSDYVQHYGLRRQNLPDGTPEPVGPQHSWNAPQLFSSALMLNAPRHSDHHVTPSRGFPTLQLREDQMPMMPYPLPVMAGLALMPGVWRRVMDARCGPWRARPWTQRPDVAARDIPASVLAAAKSGGLDPAHLPNSSHVETPSDPVPDPARGGAGPKRDERGGI